MAKNEFVNFNDEKVPLGKRKQAYIKYAVANGTSLIEAKRQANKKFGFEKKGKLAIIIADYGMKYRRDYEQSIADNSVYERRRHEEVVYVELEYPGKDIIHKTIMEYKQKGYDTLLLSLTP